MFLTVNDSRPYKPAFRKKGFTLIEAVTSVVILSSMAVGMGQMFSVVQRSWRRQKQTVDLIQNARWAMEYMIFGLRQASSALDPANPNPGGLPQGRLIRFRYEFTSPPQFLSPIIWYWRGDTASDLTSYGDSGVIYSGRGNNLTEAYAVRQQIANFIVDNPSGNAIFQKSGNLITIEITVESGGKRYTLKSQVRPRNN